MNANTLRDLLHQTPFVPFAIRMDNGVIHSVPHPDYLFIVPGGDRVIVVEEDGRFHILGLPHLSSVIVSKPRRSPPPRRPPPPPST